MPIPSILSIGVSDSGGAKVTSLSITAASGIVSGNLLLICCVDDDDSAGAQMSINATNHPGWTKIQEVGGSSAAARIAWFWRQADGSGDDGDVTVDITSSLECCGWYVRVDDSDFSVQPIHGSNGAQSPSAATHSVSHTTSVDDVLCIYGLGFDGADGYTFSISGGNEGGWIQDSELQSGTGGGAGTRSSGCIGHIDLSTAGGTGSGVITPSVTDGAAFVAFGVKPYSDTPVFEAGVPNSNIYIFD